MQPKTRRSSETFNVFFIQGTIFFASGQPRLWGGYPPSSRKKIPGTISKLLQILFYAITDTAAFTWGAFEAIGQIIVHNRAELFSGYVPQLYQFLPNTALRAQVLQTVGTIAKARPDLFRKHTFHFLSFLKDPDFQVRGYTAWILGNLAAREAREGLENLRGDSLEIGIYDNGDLQQKSVGQVASEALEKLGD